MSIDYPFQLVALCCLNYYSLTWYLFVSNWFYAAARISPRRLFHFSVLRNKKMAKGRNKLAKGGKKLKNSGGDRDARLFFFPSMASDGRRRKGEEGTINI